MNGDVKKGVKSHFLVLSFGEICRNLTLVMPSNLSLGGSLERSRVYQTYGRFVFLNQLNESYHHIEFPSNSVFHTRQEGHSKARRPLVVNAGSTTNASLCKCALAVARPQLHNRGAFKWPPLMWICWTDSQKAWFAYSRKVPFLFLKLTKRGKMVNFLVNFVNLWKPLECYGLPFFAL